VYLKPEALSIVHVLSYSLSYLYFCIGSDITLYLLFLISLGTPEVCFAIPASRLLEGGIINSIETELPSVCSCIIVYIYRHFLYIAMDNNHAAMLTKLQKMNEQLDTIENTAKKNLKEISKTPIR